METGTASAATPERLPSDGFIERDPTLPILLINERVAFDKALTSST
jgi:hypothetical protein